MPMARPRIASGKISASHTQMAMLRNDCIDSTNRNTSTAITYGRMALPSGMTSPAMPTRQWLMVVRDRPMKNVLRRSSRSMFRSAMMPPMTAARPKKVAAIRACSTLNPADSSTRGP